MLDPAEPEPFIALCPDVCIYIYIYVCVCMYINILIILAVF